MPNMIYDTDKIAYDCMECGKRKSVMVKKGKYGFCSTKNCINNELIQFVYDPSWIRAKISRAEE